MSPYLDKDSSGEQHKYALHSVLVHAVRAYLPTHLDDGNSVMCRETLVEGITMRSFAHTLRATPQSRRTERPAGSNSMMRV